MKVTDEVAVLGWEEAVDEIPVRRAVWGQTLAMDVSVDQRRGEADLAVVDLVVLAVLLEGYAPALGNRRVNLSRNDHEAGLEDDRYQDRVHHVEEADVSPVVAGLDVELDHQRNEEAFLSLDVEEADMEVVSVRKAVSP